MWDAIGGRLAFIHRFPTYGRDLSCARAISRTYVVHACVVVFLRPPGVWCFFGGCVFWPSESSAAQSSSAVCSNDCRYYFNVPACRGYLLVTAEHGIGVFLELSSTWSRLALTCVCKDAHTPQNTAAVNNCSSICPIRRRFNAVLCQP